MKNKKIIILSLLLLIFIAKYFYLHVNGQQIKEMMKNDDATIIELVKTYETSEKSDILNNIKFNSEQKDMLEALFEESDFKKIISKTTRYYDKDRYMITAKNSNNQIYFRLESYGGEFILVDSSPNHWKLKVLNENWKSKLEEIIALSQ